MWRMLQHDTPDDFVLATGEKHSVREFVEKAFKIVDVTIVWEGEAEKEIGKDSKTGKVRVRVDPKYYRPAEVELLVGDPTKAATVLGWNPSATSFSTLVEEMVKADIKCVQEGRLHE